MEGMFSNNNDVYWLVVDQPLWKMMEFVNWDHYSQDMEKKCSKPPTSIVWYSVCFFFPMYLYNKLYMNEAMANAG